MKNVTLGIDTSNYTTSVCALREGEILADVRQMLTVPEGGRGLRQSEAFYQHSMNLPVLIERLFVSVSPQNIARIGVSTRPRPVEGSYMPVFCAGQNTARVLAGALGVPLDETSHQQGHLAAGIFSCGAKLSDEFLALHVSGGTTDLIHVKKRGWAITPIPLGGTTDLNAGQFIDRVGVALGLAFPAGKELEKLAAQAQGMDLSLPSSVSGLKCSFSGAESAAQRLISQGAESPQIASAVQRCILKTLVRLLRAACEQTGISEVLAVGGVLSNAFLRKNLTDQLRRAGIRMAYALPALSADNAVGVAAIAQGEEKTI
ncbi:MAG: O-sialoglycoprotein endopeptidase [Eubacteriales bacterium]|nr:O-sialoglycoprotein endopeptidase [Eubacteriales bacterium]